MGKYTSKYPGSQIDAAVEKAHKTGPTDPTINTVGVLGQRYFNTTTGATFECKEIITVDEATTFTWRPIIANSLDVETQGQALDATQGKSLADMINDIKGEGWTDETLKGLADLISTHTGKTVSRVTGASRDISIEGTQKISLPFAAKSISVLACIANTKNSCQGFCDSALTQYGMLTAGHTGNAHPTTQLIQIYNDAYTVHGVVTLIENDGFTITWTKASGTVPSPTNISMRILAQTH